MMTRRILKKKSKQAVPILVRYYGFAAGDFFPAVTGENYHGLVIRCSCPGERCDRQWHPLGGTPMTGGMFGYETPEWDEHTALEVLRESVTWGGRPGTMGHATWLRVQRIAGCGPVDVATLEWVWGLDRDAGTP